MTALRNILRRTVAPSHVQLEVTTTCNLRCVHCGLNQPNYEHRTLSWESFEKVLPFLEQHRPSVELSGHGESLVCSRFMRMFHRTIEAGCRVSFFTNATLLTPEISDQLLEYAGPDGFHALTISLDAAEPKLFETIRRGASFDVFVGNVRALAAKKRERGLRHPKIAFNSVLMLLNLPQLPAMVELARELGGEEIVVVDLLEYDFWRNQRVANEPEAAYKGLTDAQSVAREVGIALTITPELATLIAGHQSGRHQEVRH
jgi:MoaA/NifB/PqqE/SkfB family radical SAM enzyme